MKALKEVIKALSYCDNGKFNNQCKECPYFGIEFCLKERKEDALYYLIAYEDGFYVFDKLKENLKKEKEKYNEAIQHCNKLEKKYKNMINNLIQENK